MSKKIYNEKINKHTDWGGDESTGGLPVAGNRVQEFIKEQFKYRFGFQRIAEDVVQFFEDEESADKYDEDPDLNAELLLSVLPLPSGGGGGNVQYYLRILNNLASKAVYASKGEACYISFTFVSQQRDNSDVPFVDTGERGYCQIFARSGQNEYKEVLNTYIDSGKETRIDVAPYLLSGENNVMIKVTGEETAVTTPTLVYSVQLTSLSLSANNFQWWSAFTSDIIIPMNIGGNISKILHVDVAGEDYTQSYDIQLGTNIYTETAYNYSLPHSAKTGVFNVSFFVQNADGNVRTRTLSFNLICILSGATDKLIAINNRLEKAVNWSENVLFDYTTYDAGKVSTPAKFIVNKAGEQIYISENDAILTASKQAFTVPLEVETLDNTDFDIVAKVLDADTEMLSLTIPVDNNLGFSANAGAVFYLNPRTRNNSQANRQSVVNEMAGSTPATWNNFNWDSDAWTTDANNNKVLRVMAGSSVDIAYKPFAVEPARTGKTIEIDYKVDNVTDFAKEVLAIASSAASFVGLKIYPDNLIVHSQALDNDDFQSINVRDGQRIRLALTIMPDAYGNPGFNLCILYVNGRKNREFVYADNDYFAHTGNIIIGSDYADIDIYGIRIYDSALTSQGVLRNYINWLADNSEKVRETTDNDVMDANGSEIDFENVKDQYNVFVFDNTFPRLSNPNKYKGTLSVYFAGHPELNVELPNAEAKGQGTSSMRYWWWNIRFTLNDSWQMIPDIPSGQKFTAKKNFASSMQSHKMGSVNSFDDLYKAMGLTNEAMQTEAYANARVSVYQEPFVGFEKTVNEEGETIYTFMGLYTMGPDKGDKNTFGYDTKLFPGLISIEGSDNAPLAALFRVPWNSKMAYNPDEEAWQYNGVNSWDFDGGKEENISKWIPAYNLVYQCSPRLKPFDGTLDELNAQVAAYRNEQYEFWIAKAGDANRYNLYYYEASEGKFIPSDIGGGTINLVSQLADKGYGLTSADLTGKTNDELNTLFINARVAKFRSEAAAYFDIDDAIYHRNWVEFHAATDNRAKNTYPYSFGTETSKFKWRGDDFDTIFDTDNQGLSKKGYSVETHDLYANGAPIWNGETSNFWNLIDLSFPEEVIAGMRKMMSKMEELGDLNNGDDFDKLYAYFDKYYFSKAQKYFPSNLYNADAKFTYENAKLAYMDGKYTNDTDPITQALGDHFSAEQRWIMKRIIYMMSKYSFGTFSADGTDNVTVRAAGDAITYQLTPAIDLYPGIANGTSIIRGIRTKAGEICEMTIDLSGSGDQQNTIQGASYLQDIGHWHDKNVTGAMIIQGKMLREIRLGSKTQPVAITISSLTVANCVSLQKIDLSNISTLSGSLNLSSCTHLKEVHANGTALAQLILPRGGGMKLVEYGALNKYIQLRNYPLLENSGIIIDSCKEIITDIYISDCSNLNPIDLIASVIDAQKNQEDHALKRIRCTGFNADCSDSAVELLFKLTDGSYSGLDANGVATDDIPVIEGKIHVQSISEYHHLQLTQLFPYLEISYEVMIPPPSITLNFKSGKGKAFENPVFEAARYKKLSNSSYKLFGVELQDKVTYTFSSDNHLPVSGELTILSQEASLDVAVTYLPLRTIQVMKIATSTPLNRARVTVGGKVHTTDYSGCIYIRTLDAISGSAICDGYNDIEFSLPASDNDKNNIIYLQPYADITFVVKDEKQQLVEGATLKIDSKTLTTDSNGQCKVALKAGAYDYVVSKSTYIDTKGKSTIGTSSVVINIIIIADVENLKPEENGNIQMMLKGINATLNITSPSANYTIDWGDGTVDNAIGENEQTYTHAYADTGDYQVEIKNCTDITRCNGVSESLIAYWSIGNSAVKGLKFTNYRNTLYIGDLWKNDNSGSIDRFNNFCSSCSKLQKVKFNSLRNCKNVTFLSSFLKGCENLVEVDLSPLAGLTEVSYMQHFLDGCSSLTKVDLSPLTGLTKIVKLDDFLHGCSSLTKVDLSPLSKLTRIESLDYIFQGCRSLTEVDLSPLAELTSIRFLNGLLFDCNSITKVDLSPLAGLIGIETLSNFLSGCSNLVSIDLSPLAGLSKVTSLYNFLARCNKLSNVDLSPLSNMTKNDSLSNLLLYSNITHIDLSPFRMMKNITYLEGFLRSCSLLTGVDLSPLSDLTNIKGHNGFISDCSMLKYIIVGWEIPPLFSSFFYGTGDCAIYVPDSSVDNYKTATNWIEYADRIKPMSQFSTDFPNEA